eukprot:1082405-Pleurochrysis_carterae.AAC.8
MTRCRLCARDHARVHACMRTYSHTSGERKLRFRSAGVLCDKLAACQDVGTHRVGVVRVTESESYTTMDDRELEVRSHFPSSPCARASRKASGRPFVKKAARVFAARVGWA